MQRSPCLSTTVRGAALAAALSVLSLALPAAAQSPPPVDLVTFKGTQTMDMTPA